MALIYNAIQIFNTFIKITLIDVFGLDHDFLNKNLRNNLCFLAVRKMLSKFARLIQLSNSFKIFNN